MSTPLQVLCYSYLNTLTSIWRKVGEGLGSVDSETHRVQEKEMDTPKLPL